MRAMRRAHLLRIYAPRFAYVYWRAAAAAYDDGVTMQRCGVNERTTISLACAIVSEERASVPCVPYALCMINA